MSDPVQPDPRGLHAKFFVARTDGSSEPGGKHHECDYFVLDMVHDKHAKAAIAAYAADCRQDHPALAADLTARWLSDYRPAAEPASAGDPLNAMQEALSLLDSDEIHDVSTKAITRALEIVGCARHRLRDALANQHPGDSYMALRKLLDDRDQRIAELEAAQGLDWHQKSDEIIAALDRNEYPSHPASNDSIVGRIDEMAKQSAELVSSVLLSDNRRDKQFAELKEQVAKSNMQRDALFHECEALRSKIQPCIDCSALKDEIKELTTSTTTALAEARNGVLVKLRKELMSWSGLNGRRKTHAHPGWQGEPSVILADVIEEIDRLRED